MNTYVHSDLEELENAVDLLKRSSPAFDDLARARVRTALDKLGDEAQNSAPPATAHRRHVTIMALAAAAVLVAMVAVREFSYRTEKRSSASPPQADSYAERDSAPQTTSSPWRELPSGARLMVSPSANVRIDSDADGSTIVLVSGRVSVAGSQHAGETRVRAGHVTLRASNAVFAATTQESSLEVRVDVGIVWVKQADGQTDQIGAPIVRTYALESKKVPPSKKGRKSGPTRPQSPPPAVSAESLYLVSEELIASGDLGEGTAMLLRLIHDFPLDRRADTARYDLARVAHRRGHLLRAESLLRQILKSRREPLVIEPAHYLLCRIQFERTTDKAGECATTFRRSYPDSAHDAELLAFMAVWTHQRQGCRPAVPMYEEYLREHPRGFFRRKAETAIADCRRSR